MKTPQEIQEFIIEALLPYKEDLSLCAYENGICTYLTSRGKKCVVGQFLRPNIEVQEARLEAEDLFERFGMGILTEEAQSYKLTPEDWRWMQVYHDYLAVGDTSIQGKLYMESALNNLESKYKIDLSTLK